MRTITSESDKRKLLIPGYAGELNKEEIAYIKKNLLSNGRLRALWGFKRGTGRLSEKKIRIVAMDGVEAIQDVPNYASNTSVQLRSNNKSPPTCA